jgi:ATP-dependent Clp protease ATP-binding subunit ClpC
MFDKFSEEAIKVIMLAQEEASLLKHHWLGSEHILLGLIRMESDSLPCKVLGSFDVHLKNTRAAVEKLRPKGSKSSPKHLPFNPGAIKALECSFRAAMADDTTIKPEHILLGLLEDTGGAAVQVMESLGAERQRLRQTILYRTSFAGGPFVEDSSGLSQEEE